MYYIFIAGYVFVAICLITFIMLQQGKGANAGALGGSGGASDTVFGSSGSATFLSRLTSIFATIFFVGALLIANFNTSRVSVEQKQQQAILQQLDKKPATPTTPAQPGVPNTAPSVPGQPVTLPGTTPAPLPLPGVPTLPTIPKQ